MERQQRDRLLAQLTALEDFLLSFPEARLSADDLAWLYRTAGTLSRLARPIDLMMPPASLVPAMIDALLPEKKQSGFTIPAAQEGRAEAPANDIHALPKAIGDTRK